MILEGAQSVISAIKEKKRLIAENQSHEHIKVLLVQGGGVVRGVYGAGAAIAFEELGYSQVFSYLLGISSGAPIVSHFAAGTSRSGAEALLQNCIDADFIKPWRFWNQVDTGRLMHLLEHHPKQKIDVQNVFANAADLYFGVTEFNTALPQLIKPRDSAHFFKSMHASMNMQNVSTKKIVIDGTQYVDGGFSNPHVIKTAVAELTPTHILIIANNDRDFSPIARKERFLNRTIFRPRLNKILTAAINTRRAVRNYAFSEIAQLVPTAVVWGNGIIDSFETEERKINAALELSRRWWHGLLIEE